MTAPLQGMKILDFTYLLPGPYGSMMLADLGADIIKVENKNSPDILRYMPPLVNGMSAAFAHINRGKKSLALDLKARGAKEIIYRLLSDYDVVLEQFRPGVMDRLGLGYETLRSVNPSVIYCSLTGYGQTGEYSQRAGHDINYMSLTGVESFSGRRESGPALSGIQIADFSGGSKNMVIGALAAYIKRMNTGCGENVDISITDGVFSMTVFSSAGFLAGASEPTAEGEALNGGSLYDFYKTSDGRYLSVGPIEPKFLSAFGEGIGYGDLMNDMLTRPSDHAAIKQKIAGIIAGRDLSYWRERFRAMDACVEPVLTLKEASETNPLKDRNMITEVANAAGARFRQIANPLCFSGGRHIAPFAGTPLGFHTEEIIRSAGYSDEEIMRMKQSGII